MKIRTKNGQAVQYHGTLVTAEGVEIADEKLALLLAEHPLFEVVANTPRPTKKKHGHDDDHGA